MIKFPTIHRPSKNRFPNFPSIILPGIIPSIIHKTIGNAKTVNKLIIGRHTKDDK